MDEYACFRAGNGQTGHYVILILSATFGMHYGTKSFSDFVLVDRLR